MTQPVVLVTGGTGTVGAALVRELASLMPGHRIVVATRKPASDQVYADVRQPLQLDELTRSVTTIVHAAADTRFNLPLDEARATNTAGTQHVIDLALRCPNLEHFAHISTLYVAGRRSGLVPEAELRHDCGYFNSYEQSKHEAEDLVVASFGRIPAAIYRLSSVASAQRRHGHVRQLARLLPHSAKFPVLPGLPHAPVDLIPADWCARALAILIAREQVPGCFRHICAGPRATTVRDLIDTACAEYERLTGIAALRPRLGTLAEIENAVQPSAALMTFLPHLAIEQPFDSTMQHGLTPPPSLDTVRSVLRSEFGRPRAHHPENLVLNNTQGAARGFVDFKAAGGRPVLEDLWIMQGSICDLRCKHCYTRSSPKDEHLEQIGFDELRPHLEDAARFAVGRIYFTGGEPFANQFVLRGLEARNEEFLRSLEFALEIAPVEVLTNGRRYIRAHFDELARLRRRFGDRLRLRVTLESATPERHDELRGKGAFAQTVETIAQLGAMGFVPVITAERPLLAEPDDSAIRAAYDRLFAERGVRVEVNLIENMLEMGHELVRLERNGQQPHPEVFVSTGCFSVLQREPESLMCHFSRCIQKVDGSLRVYPCPVIYDDARFELGETLEQSFRRVYIAHKNCYDYCLKGAGASCRTRVLTPER